ncbi:hypothetical protein [Mesorhizobium sp. CAU 1732]|uniref:hypothetical protein n=1 Tax=Mesorhizobium sp. CAU 1732 TaxID=3140358 RepID=UPI003261C193
MTRPIWILKLAAAAVIPVALGMGGAVSAPSFLVEGNDVSSALMDDDYTPGEFGVDYAAVTGPMGPSNAKAPEQAKPGDKIDVNDAKAPCEDATWPYIPAGCLDGVEASPSRNIIRSN